MYPFSMCDQLKKLRFFIFFYDLVKDTLCQLNSISESVESCLYINHTQIFHVLGLGLDDCVLDAMETQNSGYQKIKTFHVAILMR